MDCGAYDSANNLIIAVRGGRAFQFNADTGIQSGNTLDYQDQNQLGLSDASIVWDNSNHVGFVSCWNTGNFNTSVSGGVRKIYRITSNPLSVSLVQDIATLFGTALNSADPQGGIGSLRIVGNVVYGVGWDSTIHPTWSVFKFTSPGFTAPAFREIGLSGPTRSFAVSGDVAFWGSQNGSDVESWDFTGSAFNSTAFDGALGYVAAEFGANRLFVTRQFTFIDQYDNSNPPVHQNVINTGRANFNGVNARLNPNNNLLYIAGGGDNTVVVVNPVDNSFVIKTGFDLPYDFTFKDGAHGGRVWCIQQGSTPLRLVT